MAPPYSNGYSPSLSLPNTRKAASSHFSSSPGPDDSLGALLANALRLLWRYSVRATAGAALDVGSVLATGTRANTLLRDGQRRRVRRPLPIMVAEAALRQLRHNLAPQRVFSVPHFLAAFWVLVLLWGERWNFHARVARCHWDHWEKWPAGTTPHHLVFVADPQLIDAHSYPGRPWPLSALTVTITDNYMRRSYRELQEQLHPDTVFFLGDLFDGGREWKPLHGEFQDPAWSSRPEREKGYAKTWRKRYGEDYWLREYARFGDLFLPRPPSSTEPAAETELGSRPGAGQRGRKIIASLPGNHDLGFGAEVKVSVRERFACYFGDSNRVDVIGNHTFVSVDTVSLSADTSDRAGQGDIQPIFQPAQQFLSQVAWEKQKAVARELRFQRGLGEEVPFAHRVEELNQAKFDTEGLRRALGQVGEGSTNKIADLPTVLLSHVPLYRPPGTPCGPMREHWPPTKPADDSSGPVFPDHRNAISVTRGYQYQNVLSEADSIKLVSSVGNVVHAFSGDDHDYCAVVHDEQQQHVPEITVKSFSMAMGVPTPGFLMVSLYNPIDETGRSIATTSSSSPQSSSPPATMQTHLCLLPNQLGTYARYGGMIAVSVVLLAIYAVLIPILNLPVFAFDPFADGGSSSSNGGGLPMYNKAKVEDDEYGAASNGSGGAYGGGGGGGGSSGSLNAPGEGDHYGADDNKGASDSSGFIAFRSPASSYSRGRSQSSQNPNQHHQHQHRHHKTRASKGGGHRSKPSSPANIYDVRSGPKIQIIRDEDSYDDDDDYSNDDDPLADDYLVDVNLGGSSSGGNRWRPAARRGVFGLSLSAVAGLRRFVLGALGLRRSGSNRRRRRQAGWGWWLGQTASSNSRTRRRGLGPGGRSSTRRLLRVAGWEFYAMAFRVTWMVAAYWAWLNHRG